MAVVKTGTQVGKMQNLSRVVKDLTANECPFVDSLGAGNDSGAANSYFEWVDKNQTITAPAPILEGATTVADSGTEVRTARSNYTQIFAKGVEMSDTRVATSQAGEKALAERLKDAVIFLTRQKEMAYLSGQSGAADTGLVGRTTASAQKQIVAGLISTATSSPSQALTKDAIDNAILALSAGSSASADSMFVSFATKRAITNILQGGIAPLQRDVGQSKVVTSAVDVYQSDFGNTKIIPTRHMVNTSGVATTDVLIVTDGAWKEYTLIPMHSVEEGRRGVAVSYVVSEEAGLKNSNWNSSALLTGFTI